MTVADGSTTGPARDKPGILNPATDTASHGPGTREACSLCEGTRRDQRLLSPSQPWWNDLTSAVRIGFAVLRGFVAMGRPGPSVTVFGSARTAPGHPDCKLARELGGRRGEAGFTVATGCGPGIMEAANRGARERESRSVGCNIRLPREQKPNDVIP